MAVITNDKHNIEDELALFEKEISSVDSHARNVSTGNGASSDPITSITSNVVPTTLAETLVHPAVHPSIGPTAQPDLRPVLGPFGSSPGLGGPVGSSVRPAPPPFLPHVMMRPGFMPQTNLAVRFIPPQLRLPMVNFMRLPVQPQPSVLESGPSLYEDATKKKDAEKDNDKDKGGETGQSVMKTQVLTADVEAIAQKKQSEAVHRSTYIGQIMRGEQKMKRFLRCGGGQVWEDKSLAEWDPNDFRIFCGDLGNEVSDELLAKAFRKYPSFQKAKVIREARTNKSKGYGFVSFKHQDDFVRACREMDGKYVGNRPIKLRKSNWRERNMDVVKKKKKQKQKLGLT